MIKLYLNMYMRDLILGYDIDFSEICDDRELFYIRNKEEYILENILVNVEDRVLERFGFNKEEIDIIKECDFEVEFSECNEHYFEGIEDVEWAEVSFDNFAKNYCE